MQTLLKGLSPDEQAEFFQELQTAIEKDNFNPLPLYHSAARRENARRSSNRMISSITGTSIAVALLGAFIGFEVAVVIGLLYLTQRFLDEASSARQLRNTIAAGEDFTAYLSEGDRHEYHHIVKLHQPEPSPEPSPEPPYEDLTPTAPIDADGDAVELVIIADKEPDEVLAEDDLETILMLYFLRRKGQLKTTRDLIKAGIKGLPDGTKQSDLEEYLLVLCCEGKLHQEGDAFYY